MKAAVLEELRKPLVVKNLPDPKCPPDGAIIRVEAEGICRSDWHLWMGDFTWVGLKPELPLIMGHEFCGIVEEIGKDVRNVKRGDRVVVPVIQGEGSCEYCRAGFSNHCNAAVIPGFSYSGGYASYVGVPYADSGLVVLPEKIDFVEAASLGCRFMTSFHGVVDQAQVKPGEWVAVFGCGGVGLSAVQIAAAMGANVIAVDLDDRKLALAKEVGATNTINAKTTDAPKAIGDLTGGGAHVAVDALGMAATSRSALLSLRKRGRHLQLGLTTAAEKGEISMPIDRIVMMGLQLNGSTGMPVNRYPAMLRMVEAGKVSPKKMVTQTISLEKASDVVQQMSNFENIGVTVINQY